MVRPEIFTLCVLCLPCIVGTAHATRSNAPPLPETQNHMPNRRFYLYNPELISHAAAALGMVVPQVPYKPLGPSLAPLLTPALSPVHFAEYGEEEDEELEEHGDKTPTNLQLFTVVKPKRTRGKKKQRKKPLKQLKKYFKKCVPFKVRIIRKSDVESSSDPLYQNIRNYLPYGYGDEYFPQPSEKQELALISLNTSTLSESGTQFPQVLHFLYPSYVPKPRSKARAPPIKKTYRFARPLPKRHAVRPFMKTMPKRPWPKVTPWRLAPPGKLISEFPLKEPRPDAVGGSPPPSPLFNRYRDTRIPVSQAYIENHVVEEQTESSMSSTVTPNYLHLYASTPRQIQYYQEQKWSETVAEAQTSTEPAPKSAIKYDEKYSDSDYYRYGTYNQNQAVNEDQKQKFFKVHNSGNFNADQVPEQNTNYDMVSAHYSYQNFATTSEKVVTVTPTTSWVPIPQLNRVPQLTKENVPKPVSKFTNYSISESKQMHYMSGGFKNLSSEGNSHNFGDKIVSPQNCSLHLNIAIKNCTRGMLKKCLGENEVKQENKNKTHKRFLNRKSSSTYHKEQARMEHAVNLVTTTSKYSFQITLNNKNKDSTQNAVSNPNASFSIEEVPKGQKEDSVYTKNSAYKNKGRSYSQGTKIETDIVTAEYPQDAFNEVYLHLSPSSSNSITVRRSNFKELSAVVSGSIPVKEN